MNNPVFRQRLGHVVDAPGDVEDVEQHGVERIHFQVEAEGVQRIVAQCGAGLKGPDDVHHAGGERQYGAQYQQRVTARVVAGEVR